jgi:hypothetical protein
MDKYADLSIVLSRLGKESFWVELRFTQPDERIVPSPERGPARLNFEALRLAALKPEQYGRLLSDALFYDDLPNQVKLLTYLNGALAIVQDAALDLHVSLFVDPSAAELHHLHWETLLNPQDGSFLAWDQNVLLSRHLYARELGQMELRSKGELRALVFVANPADLARPLGFSLRTGADSQRSLAPVDVTGEVERAKTVLKDVKQVDVLSSDPHQPGQATLDNLLDRLNSGYDIIYLVCHGALLPDDPDAPGSLFRAYILLEKADGSLDIVNGERLVSFIRDLHLNLRPRLMVLASCQSAGQGQTPNPAATSTDHGELSALGPLLAESGIPAVLAMLENVQQDTVAKFMPVFFKQLLSYGLVDRAMAAARSAVQSRPDWWAPVLFMRLTGGELWFDAGFSSRDNEFDTWRGIIDSIQPELVPNRKSKKTSYCTPVLGIGLLEPLIGTPREIACRWAEVNRYPFDVQSRESLPQVAQYLAIRQGPAVPRTQLVKYLRNRLVEKYGALLKDGEADLPLPELASTIGKRLRQQNPEDPFAILAKLPFEIYITANPDHILEDALEEQGRPAQSRCFHWKRSLIDFEQDQLEPPIETPTVARPLVYHLFGCLEDINSLVLAEDDFFDFLMCVNKNEFEAPIPEVVNSAWTENALLFLGYQMSDWTFRLLFRSILSDDRRKISINFKSVAVQLQPGDGAQNPDVARSYLKQYFPDRFNIYWGKPDEFLSDLWRNWKTEKGL